MLMNKQFNTTMERLGVDSELNAGEYDLATLVWHRCEAAFMKRSAQAPALLKSDKLDLSQSLTRQEIQFLTDLFSSMLSLSEINLHEVKNDVQEYWSACDPENSDTLPFFNALNELRDLQRKWKKAHKQLSTIQHKLKKNR